MTEKDNWLSQEDIQAYNTYTKEYDAKKDNKSLTIENLDLSRYVDQRIFMEVLLRDKTEEEIKGIVHGLQNAHYNAATEKEKDMFLSVSFIVMDIGEATKGISWN